MKEKLPKNSANLDSDFLIESVSFEVILKILFKKVGFDLGNLEFDIQISIDFFKDNLFGEQPLKGL